MFCLTNEGVEGIWGGEDPHFGSLCFNTIMKCSCHVRFFVLNDTNGSKIEHA